MRGKRPVPWCSFQSRAPPGVLEDEPRGVGLVAHQRWAPNRSARAPWASTRGAAASCASVAALRAAGLLDDVRRPGARGRPEHPIAPRGVDDREVLLDDMARLDKGQRQEIVGNV